MDQAGRGGDHRTGARPGIPKQDPDQRDDRHHDQDDRHHRYDAYDCHHGYDFHHGYDRHHCYDQYEHFYVDDFHHLKSAIVPPFFYQSSAWSIDLARAERPPVMIDTHT
jgi:hypothetical protein